MMNISFKVGKFYELYNMDADTGVRELDLVYMKGELAHCGFPEIAYGKMAGTLVELGYKVARVEQTETPDAKTERVKLEKAAHKRSGSKQPFPKERDTTLREVCSILSPGTRTFSFNDEATFYNRKPGADGAREAPPEPRSTLLLAVVERALVVAPPADAGGAVAASFDYGVCLLDAPTGACRARPALADDGYARLSRTPILM